VRYAALAFAIAAVACLLWIGSEEHYQSCVERAAATPLSYTAEPFSQKTSIYATPTRSYDVQPDSTRRRRLKDCSRLPF
jgi:hypothetical protein